MDDATDRDQATRRQIMHGLILGQRGFLIHTSNEPARAIRSKIRGKGRNAPCPCGRGLKTKRCCGATPQNSPRAEIDTERDP